MWLLLQLSELPAGGFAHSAGLEAAHQCGGLASIESYVAQAISQAGRLGVPFVVTDVALADADDRCDAVMSSHVGNRASRAQGRALASASNRIFSHSFASKFMHHAPIYGALCRALAVSKSDAARLYLHGVARAVLSAAVRLGILGPLEAQRIQAANAPRLEAVHAASLDLSLDAAASVSPLLELYGALHDTLETRLFQS